MEDVAEIDVVHVRCWQVAYRGLLPQAYVDGLDPGQRIGQWERSLSAAKRSDGGTLVAGAGGRLSGFVSYGPARDDDAESRRAGEIYAIYLVPAAWGAGIGRQLMTASAASARRPLTGSSCGCSILMSGRAASMRRAAGLLMGQRSEMTVSAFP
jgi:GNAT superfamily N-acetyltransferase